MPIYEYICKDCGEDFEALVYLSSNKKPECPKCRGTNLNKKISRIASGKSECGSCTSTSCGSGGFS